MVRHPAGSGDVAEIAAALATVGKTPADFGVFADVLERVHRSAKIVSTLTKGEPGRKRRIDELTAYLRQHPEPVNVPSSGPVADARAECSRLADEARQQETAQQDLQRLRGEYPTLFGDNDNGCDDDTRRAS